jgi:hypothetical protein
MIESWTANSMAVPPGAKEAILPGKRSIKAVILSDPERSDGESKDLRLLLLFSPRHNAAQRRRFNTFSADLRCTA